MSKFQILRREGDNEPSPVLDAAGDMLLFESGAEASANAKRMQETAAEHLRSCQAYAEASGTECAMQRTVFFVKPYAMPDDTAWHIREIARFRTGDYMPLPWDGDEWWRKALAENKALAYHFAHVSADDPSRVAYTPTSEHGHSDRQVRISPAKYLLRYFDVTNEFAAAQAERMSSDASDLKWAITAEDIEHVYAHGPSSCMAHSTSDYKSHVHPTAAYGDSDYRIAYCTDPANAERIVSRAVVYYEKRVYGRIYGADRLRMLLDNAGYTAAHDSCDMWGGRLRAIEVPDANGIYVVPYFDMASCGSLRKADDGQNYIYVDNEGRIDLHRTDGVSEALDGDTECALCGDMFFSEDGGTYLGNGDAVCESCTDRHVSYCAGCQESYNSEDTAGYTVDGESICQSCADSDYTHCDGCNHMTCDTTVEIENGNTLCTSCAEDYVQVEDADYVVPSDEACCCECCSAYYTANGMQDGSDYCTACVSAEYVVEVNGEYIERSEADECAECGCFALKDDMTSDMCPDCAEDKEEDTADVA